MHCNFKKDMRIFVKISGSPSVTGLVANSVAYSENDDATIKRISVHRSEPNYTYVIVNSDRNVYFVKSDETYDEGYLSEDYTVALKDVAADQIPSDLMSGGTCYLRTLTQYLEGTRQGVAPYYEWSFDFFDTADFLYALQSVGEGKMISAGGEMSEYGRTPQVIDLNEYGFALNVCNSSKVDVQKIPFSVIYKEEFPEESSYEIIGGGLHPIGGGSGGGIGGYGDYNGNQGFEKP